MGRAKSSGNVSNLLFLKKSFEGINKTQKPVERLPQKHLVLLFNALLTAVVVA